MWLPQCDSPTTEQLTTINLDCFVPRNDAKRQLKISADFTKNCFYKSNFGNLGAIKDNYPKYVISMTPLVTRNDDNGITHLHLRKFLMERLEG